MSPPSSGRGRQPLDHLLLGLGQLRSLAVSAGNGHSSPGLVFERGRSGLAFWIGSVSLWGAHLCHRVAGKAEVHGGVRGAKIRRRLLVEGRAEGRLTGNRRELQILHDDGYF